MALEITSPNSYSFPKGLAVYDGVTADGGFPPYVFSTESELPAGVELTSNGSLRGLTTTAQTKTINLVVTDSNADTATKTITMTVFNLPVGSALYAWGYAKYGQLGQKSLEEFIDSPVHVGSYLGWKSVYGGFFGGAGIKENGTLWLWGRNAYGTIGDNTSKTRKTPVQTVYKKKSWKEISISGHVAAIKNNGTLWMWGSGTSGQLGDNKSKNKSIPAQTVAGGTDWKQTSCGLNHTAAIKTDGTLWTWGDNAYGQLGTNSVIAVSSPVQTISGGTNWKQVSCGHLHTAEIKEDGTLWLWGKNNNFIPDGRKGALGDNTIIDRSSPVQTIALGTDWKSVSCGFNFTAAIKNDNTLWLWGDNSSGQLGTDSVIHTSSPVQTIAGGTDWNKIDCGVLHVSALKQDGTLWLWGFNYNGQIGDLGINGLGNVSSPVQTIMGGTGWYNVSAGAYNTYGIYKTL